MKFPGGNPLLFCEQVSTVTSFFEQWNDCERTVVLYALLKRVPFANLKFLQLSIDYNLAQNYSTQSKLQLLETHANNANFLNKLVQRYQTSGDVVPASTTTTTTTTTNGLTISDSGFQEISSSTDKKNTSNSTFDLSSGSSASSTTSSTSSSTSSTDPAKAADKDTTESTSPATTPAAPSTTESKKDILNDMLTYLPLLKPGNDDVKSVYMSLIPAAVEDACQRAVPTELVQHILSYLLIHPAVNNDDRRSLSYWLRHLEEHIASTYIPTTLATPSATANNNNNNSNSSNSKLATVTNNNNNNSNYYTQNNHHHHSQQHHQQQTSKSGSQQSLQFLAATATAAPWNHLHPQQQQQNQHSGIPAAIGSSSSSSLLSISNSSLLSKSQQSLNQSFGSGGGGGGGGAGPGGGGGGGGSSTSSSSSGLDSGASQLKTAGSGSSSSSISVSANNSSSSTTASTMMINLDWTTSTQQAATDVGGDGKVLRGSMENVTLKEFGPVTFNYPRDNHQLSSQSSALPPPSSQTTTTLNGTSAANSGGVPGGSALNGSVATSVLADLDSSSDDNHLSFSKNGTEIFDYDCDYDNEEEFYNLARAAAAVASIPGVATGTVAAAGSVVTPGGIGGGGKNRVSFDANISDYLRVPPIGDLELDGSGLLKTRRSNSLTTTVSSGCGLAGVGEQLHHQQKQNNECLSAENLSQLMQNKPRSFSLTMESPRSSLTSSGSETRLDDFKQHHHMMKMYGTQPNVGMASIAHWLKSLRLHKYVWLFSNLTYEQMMEMTEEYLASLGVTKGARHKLVLCIQKLRERYATMVRLEKELLAAGGGVASKAQLGAVFEELTNIVLTPMKPAGTDPKEDIGTQFLKLIDLIASILLVRAAASPQDEEYLNVYCWLLERAMHNEAFSGHVMQLKEYKYKANKMKMQYAPKGGGGHYGKSSGGLGGSGGLGVGLGGGNGGSGVERGIPMNGNLGKPRWSVSNKHNKPCGGSSEGLQKSAPHRKSSLQYFSSPMQSGPGPQQNPASSGNSSSTHLQAIPPHGYYGPSVATAGTGHNNSYNKSSSYPNFASNLSGGGGAGESVKHHRPPPQHVALGHGGQLQQQVPPPPQQQQPPHVPPHGGAGNFMYHRHSLNNISAHQHQQQFLQQLQQSQQQQAQLLPSIYLTTMGGVPSGGKKEVPVPKEQQQQHQKSDDSGKSQNNNSIGDINSRLEFLCLQMTEQAIN